jgi:hypothetical protein
MLLAELIEMSFVLLSCAGGPGGRLTQFEKERRKNECFGQIKTRFRTTVESTPNQVCNKIKEGNSPIQPARNRVNYYDDGKIPLILSSVMRLAVDFHIIL